jgi:glycosyltransferase involved in cell wall biosynthesis
MDVLCAPSRTTPAWREQFGRMLIEGMAAGVPIVASNSGEIPHVVADAGVLLPEDDVAEWARTLETLLRDEPARASLRCKGLGRARAEFAWPHIAARHLRFFDELIAS